MIASTSDDGSHPWIIPNTPSAKCLVKVCDAEISDCCGSSNESFKISECGPLEIVTESLLDGKKGCPYNETITASGGILPYAWYVVSGSGILPPGLDLDKDTGTISGKPDSIGTFCFTLRVVDDEITFDSKEYCVTIHPHDYEKGDANIDCAIDILDVVFAVNIVLNLVEPTPDQNVCTDCNGPSGNCDGDGEVNILDAIKIVNLILGLDECP